MPAHEAKCKHCGCALSWNARLRRWEPSLVTMGLTCRVTSAGHSAVKK